MFHHFHDGKLHKKSQGSISANDLYKLIKYIGRHNILDAEIFYEKFINKKLKKTDVCFTFDDSIRCQLDVALPVLEDLKIKSIFFVYTSLLEGKPDNLEIYRHFRHNYFKKGNDKSSGESTGFLEFFVAIPNRSVKTSTAENAQQEPHLCWFLIGEMSPFHLLSAENSVGIVLLSTTSLACLI